jgi:transposase
VTTPSDPLPADLAAAHAMILAQREQLTLAKSEVTVGRLEIERLKLMLAKARREQFGQSSAASCWSSNSSWLSKISK